MDISMRRRLSTPKASPLTIKRTPPPTMDKNRRKISTNTIKTDKMSWFKSLDRRAKSKSKEKVIFPNNLIKSKILGKTIRNN